MDKTFTDIDFSFIPHPITKDITILRDEDAIKQAVRNLVYTQNYEKPFRPDIGCQTIGLLFENISSLTSIMIQKSVETVLRNFEPRIRVLNIHVDVSPDENGYNLTVEYMILNHQEPFRFTFFLERLR